MSSFVINCECTARGPDDKGQETAANKKPRIYGAFEGFDAFETS
jgi:hypothetical protein